MDREPEELQFLGFFGICREANKLILSCRRLFSQIALALILPLSFLFLAHVQISDIIFSKIDRNVEELDDVPDGSAAQNTILSRILSEWGAFILFKGLYLLFVLVFSLLSTSAIVYTVACVYTAKDVSIRKVITVVPKVWKRLMITFLWSFAILFVYHFALIVVLIIVILVFSVDNPDGSLLSLLGTLIIIVIVALYLIGLVYISIVWHLASVVSVLEDMYGIAAMQKSKNLIKGKAWVVAAVFILFQLMFVAVEVAYKKLVVHGWHSGLGVGFRVGIAGVILSAMTMVVLMALVAQTVVYFVCKSYHHESIDKSSLSDHLEVYLGEYVPLREKDLQLEQFHV